MSGRLVLLNKWTVLAFLAIVGVTVHAAPMTDLIKPSVAVNQAEPSEYLSMDEDDNLSVTDLDKLESGSMVAIATNESKLDSQDSRMASASILDTFSSDIAIVQESTLLATVQPHITSVHVDGGLQNSSFTSQPKEMTSDEEVIQTLAETDGDYYVATPEEEQSNLIGSDYFNNSNGTRGAVRGKIVGESNMDKSQDSNPTTEASLAFTMVKWSLIGVLVVVPLVLLPVLFLFARGKSGESGQANDGNQDEEEQQGQQKDNPPSGPIPPTMHESPEQELANPLVITKRDFTKMDLADTQQTPRGSGKSVQFKFASSPLRADGTALAQESAYKSVPELAQ